MKKLITLLLVSFLVTTKLLSVTYSISVTSSTTAAQLNSALSTAAPTYKDITIEFPRGASYTLTGTTIVIPATVVKLTFLATGSGTIPSIALDQINYSDALMTDGITFSSVKLFTTIGGSKSLFLPTTTNVPAKLFINNCWVEGYKAVVSLVSVLTPISTVSYTNSTFKSIGSLGILSTGGAVANAISNVDIQNNTFIDCNLTGSYFIDYRSTNNTTTNLTFSNNTVYYTAAQGNGFFRLTSSPTTGVYKFENNLFATTIAGSTFKFAYGSSYSNITGTGNYYSSNFNTPTNVSSGGLTFTAYTENSPSTLFKSPASPNYDFTINDPNWNKKMSVGNSNLYYPATLTLGSTSLSGFTYDIGAGPSTPAQSFTISALALRSVINMAAPTDFEISQTSATDGFTSGSLTLGSVGGDLASTSIYVRLISGLATGEYNAENIIISTSGVTPDKTVSCTGIVASGLTKLSVPTGITTSLITNEGFDISWDAVTNAESYTVKIYQGASELIPARITGITHARTSVTGLSFGTTYTYTVTAISNPLNYDNSNESSPTSVTTLNTTKSITAFNVTGQASSSINGTTITVYIPYGTVISTYTPEITHNGSSYSPTGAQDFSTGPIQYTVTAEDGTTQIYSATVMNGSSTTDYFRTKATGNWNNASTWQSSPNTGADWYDATVFPDASAGSVTLLHNVTYNGTPASISNATVNSGVTLTNTTTSIAVASTKTLTISSGAIFDNQIDNAAITASSGSIQVNGTYKYSNSTAGGNLTFTNVVFGSSSTLYVGGTGAPRIPASVAGNIEWASTAGGTILNSATNTIAGNFTISNGSPVNNGSGGSGRALTISGDLILTNGTYNPQGLTGATQDLTVNGNVYLSGASKLYAVNPTATGVGNVTVKGNIFIQSPTDVALGAGGGTSGAFKLGGTSQQTVSSDNSSGYAIDAVTITNTAGVLVNSNLTVGTITINASTILGVVAGKNLTVNTALINNGTLNLASSESGTATIITPATISGSGTYNIQQYLTGGMNSGTSLPNGRFWYVSSPVSGAYSAVFDPASGNKLWSFAEATNTYTQIMDGLTELTRGKGYVARMITATPTVQFTGTPNNGEVIVNVTRNGPTNTRGFDIIGNPYPSYLDWKNAVKIDMWPTAWFRTATPAGDAMIIDTYNASTDEATGNGVRGLATRYIAPMQAFWVKALHNGVTGQVTFNNTLRSHQASNLLRSAETTVEKSVVRLQVSNGTNIDQAVLAFMDGATDAFDAYDSEKMFNNVASIPEIYTIVGSEKVSISGMAPFSGTKTLSLGFNTAVAGRFSIQAKDITNLEGKVTLIDNLLKVSQNLNENPVYTFNSDVVSSSDRFIVLIERMATGLVNTQKASAVIFAREDGRIQIETNGVGNNQASITVYSVSGQLLNASKATTTSTVLNSQLKPGLYLVTVSAEGLNTTQKVIIK
jgi:hypothetical protein